MNRIRHCPNPESWATRLSARSVQLPNGCWQWAGSLDHNGYGRMRVTVDGERRETGAHRASWLAFRGSIEGDLVIDHLCRNVACVNPDHLEPVSNSTNTARGSHANKPGRSGRPRAMAGEPASCPTHARTDGYWFTDNKGYVGWTCRACRRERTRRYRAARRS